MKILTLSTLAILLSVGTYAQLQKVTIYCYVDDYGRVNYGDLSKWLPDSIRKNVIVPMKRDFRAAKGNALMNMNLHGWKLASTVSDAGSIGSGSVSTSIIYLFSRDIEVDDKTFAALQGELSSLNPDNNKK
jgi:hypothetical protein